MQKPVAPEFAQVLWFLSQLCSETKLQIIVPKGSISLVVTQIQGMTVFMGEDHLVQRMHNLSLEEGTQLATYKRLRKFSQEGEEGQRGQQGGSIFQEVICALMTPSPNQPLVMMMRRVHMKGIPLLQTLLLQLSEKEKANPFAQKVMSTARAQVRVTEEMMKMMMRRRRLYQL